MFHELLELHVDCVPRRDSFVLYMCLLNIFPNTCFIKIGISMNLLGKIFKFVQTNFLTSRYSILFELMAHNLIAFLKFGFQV